MKQLTPFKLIALFTLTVVLLSCGKDEGVAPYDSTEDYVPLTVGSYIEYKLDSTIYSDFDNSVVTRNYLMKLEIIGKITDGENDDLYKFNRSLKPVDGAQEYQLKNVWFAKVKNGKLEATEDNLRFIKMISPLINDKTWKGNEFISPSGNDNPVTSTRFYEDWDYTYKAVGEPATINGNSFENTVTISQVDKVGGPGAINHYVASEIYAKGVGLVKKRMEMVVENCGANGCSEKNLPILERTRKRKGFILNQEVIDYDIK